MKRAKILFSIQSLLKAFQKFIVPEMVITVSFNILGIKSQKYLSNLLTFKQRSWLNKTKPFGKSGNRERCNTWSIPGNEEKRSGILNLHASVDLSF